MGALRDRMAEDLVLRRLSPSTSKTYLHYARRFAKHYGRSPTELGEEDIRAYLLHLIEVELVSHQAYRQSVAALEDPAMLRPTALSQAADCVNHKRRVKQRLREFEPYGPLTQSKP